MEVPFEPTNLGIAFEGKDVGRHPIEEPTIVADDHRASGEGLERVFEGS